MNLTEESKAFQESMVRVRREIHGIAEVGNQTFQTARVIQRELRAVGIPDEDISILLNGAGIAAAIHGGKPGKCLAIRVDCDALPMPELTDEPFKAVNGNMHSCGHDTHTAMGLGAAKLLFDNRENLCGTVKIIFQPGEETDTGAKAMIAEGVLENPHVDAALGMHCTICDDRLPEFPCGSIATTSGFPASACSMSFRVTFYGKGAHGGMSPHLGIDPIFMSAAAIVQLQAVISREKDPNDCAVLSICHIESGTKSNIIPETAFFEGTIRTLDQNYSQELLNRVTKICGSVAESMRGSCDVKVLYSMNELKIDPAMLVVLRKSAAKIVGENHVYTFSKPAMAGEDFSHFSEHVPTVHFNHSQRYADNREQFPNHNSHFIACEDGFWSGAAVAAQFAFDWLERA